MMLYVAILLALLAYPEPSLGDSFSEKHMHDIAQAVTEFCLKKTGAKKEDLTLFHDFGHMSATKESKCMVACITETYGSLKPEDDSVVPENVDLYMHAAFKKEDRDKGRDVFNGCIKSVKKDADHCEYAFNVIQCFLDGVNGAGLKPIPFW